MSDVGEFNKEICKKAIKDSDRAGDDNCEDNPYIYGGGRQFICPWNGKVHGIGNPWDAANTNNEAYGSYENGWTVSHLAAVPGPSAGPSNNNNRNNNNNNSNQNSNSNHNYNNNTNQNFNKNQNNNQISNNQNNNNQNYNQNSNQNNSKNNNNKGGFNHANNIGADGAPRIGLGSFSGPKSAGGGDLVLHNKTGNNKNNGKNR